MNSAIQNSIARLKKQAAETLTYKDPYYRGKPDHFEDDVELSAGRAAINAYSMWLQSAPFDYIREPYFGGFFHNLLREYEFDPASEERIRQDLIKETNEKFPNITILDLEVKMNEGKKGWDVHIHVTDNITGYTDELNEEIDNV